MNFCKQFKGNLQCSLKCNAEETQDLIIENYGPIKKRVTYPVKLSYIYWTLDEQMKVVKTLIEIDLLKKDDSQDTRQIVVNMYNISPICYKTCNVRPPEGL